MFNLTRTDIESLIDRWWHMKGKEETDRKATSVELSGVLPDGTKFAIKEYARDSEAAYETAALTLTAMQRDHTK